MPKSKRAKVVGLTKTKKKGRKHKEKLVDEIRECCDTYSHVYVFSVENMRNSALKEVRTRWTGSRIFMGRTKVMALSLGRSAESEYKDGLHRLAQETIGNRGLLFTNSEKKTVLKYFSEFSEPHFARSGFAATRSFSVMPGPLKQFGFSMEPNLRKLGLPTKLKEGVINLEAKVIVCKRGDVLTPEQCKILELFGQKQAVMRMHVHGMWNDGKFEKFEVKEAVEEEEEEEAHEGEVVRLGRAGGGLGGPVALSGSFAPGGARGAASKDFKVEEMFDKMEDGDVDGDGDGDGDEEMAS